MFDCRVVAVNSDDEVPGRYHLLLSSRGQPVQHGWWWSEAVARDKLLRWIGSVGNMPEPRITLVDEEAGDVLTEWPEEA